MWPPTGLPPALDELGPRLLARGSAVSDPLMDGVDPLQDGMTIDMVKETRTPTRTIQRDTAPKRDAAREKAKRKAARAARKRQR